jgi:hypothetical protein
VKRWQVTEGYAEKHKVSNTDYEDMPFSDPLMKTGTKSCCCFLYSVLCPSFILHGSAPEPTLSLAGWEKSLSSFSPNAEAGAGMQIGITTDNRAWGTPEKETPVTASLHPKPYHLYICN